ncbi:hypothetical protein [Intestinimonas massiliensis (ex Afouda et al. 2020)]|uniref:hypothetical protein n=1 Tax=Intestinimonas massiliensis (ex Afouda et al. 2020) TaxID=1673721 RepID=UPI001030413C|nr:hypothetical protein [Intestinimonas massiliensis (ex Afouda et al. 2020)]
MVDRLRHFLPLSRRILFGFASAVLLFFYLWLDLLLFRAEIPILAVLLVLFLGAVLIFSIFLNIFFFLLKKPL